VALGLLASVAAATDFLPQSALTPPPSAVTLDGRRVVFHADSLVYESTDDGATWEVRPGRGIGQAKPLFLARRIYTDTSGVETIFQSELGQDAARVLVRRFDGLRVDAVAGVVLYDRWDVRETMGRLRGRKFLITPEDTIPAAPKPAPALFSEIRRAGHSLWLGVGWEAGTGRGVGALIRHELDTGETRIYRPIALENWTPARLALTPDAVWIAAGDTVDGAFGTRTLLRFDPLTEDLEEMPLLLEPPGEIRVLESASDTVWLATRLALHRLTDEGATWSRWRFRSKIRVSRREEISSLPGEASRRAIPSGTYFVLAMTVDSLLVQTDDGIEGWVPPDSLSGDPVALREAPDFRAPALGLFPAGEAVERLPLRTADGWGKARVRAGWLLRSERTPEPVVGEPFEVARQ